MSPSPQELLELCSDSWSSYLLPEIRIQISTALRLYEREYLNPGKFQDYSFIVFPMSKGYEGFLKQYFFDLGLISAKTYEGKRFRIGRSLNPDIRQNQRDDWWLFDDIAQLCGEHSARMLWDTWLTCRNRVFHFFPQKTVQFDLATSGNRLQTLATTMKTAVVCRWSEVKSHKKEKRLSNHS